MDRPKSCHFQKQPLPMRSYAIHGMLFFQVEAVIRQRDMYRVLLANSGQTPVRKWLGYHTSPTYDMTPGFKPYLQSKTIEGLSGQGHKW